MSLSSSIAAAADLFECAGVYYAYDEASDRIRAQPLLAADFQPPPPSRGYEVAAIIGV